MAKGFNKLYEDSVKVLQRKREQALKRANTGFFNNLRSKYGASGQMFSLYLISSGDDYYRDSFDNYAEVIAYIEKVEMYHYVSGKDKPYFQEKLDGIRNVIPTTEKPSRFVYQNEGNKSYENGYEIRIGNIDDIIERIVDEVERCEKLHASINSGRHRYDED